MEKVSKTKLLFLSWKKHTTTGVSPYAETVRQKGDLVEVAYNLKRLYTVCKPLEVKQKYMSMMYRLSNNNDSIIDVL